MERERLAREKAERERRERERIEAERKKREWVEMFWDEEIGCNISYAGQYNILPWTDSNPARPLNLIISDFWQSINRRKKGIRYALCKGDWNKYFVDVGVWNGGIYRTGITSRNSISKEQYMDYLSQGYRSKIYALRKSFRSGRVHRYYIINYS